MTTTQRAVNPARRRRPVIALFGPTGVGKTELAIALAARLRALGEDPVAISADAMQVYRGLETLTAAPTPAERRQLDHQLVSFVPVTRTFSVGEYMPLAHRAVDAALESGRTPIVVGGTGLYVRAALCELDLRPAPPPGLRAALEARLAEHGPEELHRELAARAPALAARIPPRDRSRIVRALELLAMGVNPEPVRTGRNRLWTRETRLPTVLVGVVMARENLYERIGRRAERIFARARDEVVAADAAGASRTARQAIGFEEVLRGDLEGLKRQSRRLAKAQLTWLRKLPDLAAVDVTDLDAERAAERILAQLRRREHG